MPSARLAESLDALPAASFSGEAFRHVALERHPLSGAGARVLGGRWNPPESFSTLYLGLTVEIVTAEFNRMATRQGRAPEDFLPRRLYTYQVQLEAVIDLTHMEARSSLGLSDIELAGDDLTACQAIGETAQFLGYEGIIAPSAAGHGQVLAVFTDSLQAGSDIEVKSFEDWRMTF